MLDWPILHFHISLLLDWQKIKMIKKVQYRILEEFLCKREVQSWITRKYMPLENYFWQT